MKVRWTEPAYSQWQESFEYIEAENASAARRLAGKVFDAVEMLSGHPYAGHISQIEGLRQFAVPRSQFVIIYAVDQRKSILSVLAVYDGRRLWPKDFARD